jgi:hypothetical protein
MRVLVAAAMVGLLLGSVAPAQIPKTFQYDGQDLVRTKQQYQAGDAHVPDMVKHLLAEADKALAGPTYSVVNKPFTPPSGDKHDYVSLSPYWWPDPSKQDGKPYIRKDGQVNPERLKYDQPTMVAFAEAVETLADAYYFSGDEKYATKCAQLIRVWYFDDATRMNPNCRYGQIHLGDEKAQGTAVLECNQMRHVVDADALLTGSSSWSKDDHEKLQAWFKQFLNYLLTTKQGDDEHNAPNNHGTWFCVQATTYALYLGDDATAKKLIDEQAKKRIATQIEPDGRQPLELVRTKAYDYSRFNLEALENVAMLADHLGIDLWNYKTDDGRCLRAALDWLAPYATGDKKWEGQQITDPKMAETIRVYRFAAKGFKDAKYETVVDAVRKRGNLPAGDRTDLMYPMMKLDR